jgi:hypothetical protein
MAIQKFNLTILMLICVFLQFTALCSGIVQIKSTFIEVYAKIERMIFGDDIYLSYDECIRDVFRDGEGLSEESRAKIPYVCAQITHSKTKRISGDPTTLSPSNTVFYVGDEAYVVYEKHSTDILMFYILFYFLPFAVLFFILRDILALFSLVSAKTANLLAVVMALFSVYIFNGLFEIILGIMVFLGGYGGQFGVISLFFTLLFFSVLIGLITDALFRTVLETGRVQRAVQYQMYEIAAETALGKARTELGKR